MGEPGQGCELGDGPHPYDCPCGICRNHYSMPGKPKPPIGVEPTAIWKTRVQQERAGELAAACHRYRHAGFEPRMEWVVELCQLPTDVALHYLWIALTE